MLDHLVSVDADLSPAAARYRQAGFPVRPGGRHTGQPTQNQLVPLAGGPYLELLGPTDEWIIPTLSALRGTEAWAAWAAERGPIPRRFLDLLARGAGMGDLCFGADDLGAVVQRVRAAGVAISDAIPMERLRPDGVRIAWRLAVPADPFLPFLVEDETPRQDRLPAPPDPSEGMPAAVAWLRVAVPDLEAARVGYEAILGQRGSSGRSADGLPAEADAMDFDVGETRVRVVERAGVGLAHRLEVGLRVTDGAVAGELPTGIHVLGR